MPQSESCLSPNLSVFFVEGGVFLGLAYTECAYRITWGNGLAEDKEWAMTDSFTKRGQALEEEYFLKKNQEALQRINERDKEKPRLSPITGEPMEQLTIMGVVIDRCPTSKGIWLDAGELEEILEASKTNESVEHKASLLADFFSAIAGGK
ncbi:MAG: zf-TFIIB domain-containing protein [Bdellovibrionales bacterium]|nr:zf-TFIIB domain-containing protein [Bdellovibrionales bacterium]